MSETAIHIALIGFMGSGKSQIGIALANKTGLLFIDLDSIIEKIAGMSISDIFLSYGEAHFRQLELKALEMIAESEQAIVLSCGGGIVLGEPNRRILSEMFTVVWLDVPVDEISKRLEKTPGNRPLLAGIEGSKKIKELFNSRYELYKNIQHLRYIWQASDFNAEISADRIIEALQVYGNRLS
jgi:shikimate kinase